MNTKLLVITFISIYLKWVISQSLNNHIVADDNGMYHIFWAVDVENITFEVQVATKGYVGFGLSSNGGMAGSDIVIGWVLDNGQAYFQDRHALGNYEPLIDQKQNYNLINAYENETHTVLRFTRELNTCDNENDTIITNSTMKIIYCWHPDDPQTITGLQYHGSNRRGAKNSLLLSPPHFPIEITDGLTTWDIHIPNITIPNKSITYYCFGVKLPPFTEPHYYTGFTIVIPPENKDVVHHLAMFACYGDSTDNEEFYQNTKNPYECRKPETSSPYIHCRTQMITWNPGMQGEFYPKGVGKLLGEENGDPLYFQINIHYSNIEKKQGIVDRTILRVFLSKGEATKKAGFLTMQSEYDYSLIIPPQQPEFKISAYCPSECTSMAFPKEGINVFGVSGHTHLKGTKVSIRHFRDNKELVPILVDDNFDFNYQEVRHLPETLKIMPGDMLHGTCVYSTMDKNETVLGGIGTVEEMCHFSLYYYPMVELKTCIVTPSYEDIFQYFGVEKVAGDNVHIIAPASLRNQSMYDIIRHHDWTEVHDAKLEKIQSLQYDAEKTARCENTNIKKVKAMTVPVSFPTDFAPYIPPPSVCETRT